MGVASLFAAAALAVSPAQFVQAHADGGAYAEPGGRPDALLTSWAVLGLRATRNDAPGSLAYLQSQEGSLRSTTDVALVALAEQSLGVTPTALLDRLRTARRASGQIGEGVNSTCWAVLALGRSTTATTKWLLARQSRSGGWSWAVGGQPDSNDTAAALEALHVAGVRGAPVTRAVALSAHVPEPRRRLRADERTRIGCAVDGMGDPGPGLGRPEAAAHRVRIPRAAQARGWELSLLVAIRGDARLGDVTGPRGPRAEAVPVGLDTRRGVRPADTRGDG